AVRLVAPLLVRCSPADDGPAANHRRTGGLRARRADSRDERFRVMPVDMRHDMPTIGREALRRIVGEPTLHLAVDRDAVVVIEGDELTEAERTGQRAGLVRDSFHQASIARTRTCSDR